MKMYLGAVVAMFVGASCLFLTPYSPISFGDSNQEASAVSVTGAASSADDIKATPGQRHVVVALASPDQLSGNIEFLVDQLKLPGQIRPMIDGTVDMVVSAFDQDKPAGAVMDLVGKNTADAVWCLPVNDINAFEDLLGNFGKVKKGDPVSTFSSPGKPTLHFKQERGYVFVSDDKAHFAIAPADPEQLFGSLISDNLIFAQFNVQQFSQHHRDTFWARFTDGAGSKHLQETLERWSELAADADQFSIGLKVDQSTTQIVANTQLTFLDGSPSSQKAAKEMENQPTQFAGFKKDMNTGFSLNYCSNTTAESFSWAKQEIVKLYEGRKKMKNSLRKYTGEAKPESDKDVEALTEKILDIFDEAIATGRVDAGGNFFFYKGQPNLALGCYVGDSSELKKVFENEIVEQLRKNDSEFSIEKNVAQHNDIVFHQFTSPNGEFFQTNYKLDKRSPVVVGFGDDTVYFARGNVALKALKRCILNSEKMSEEGIEQSDLEGAPSMCNAQFRAIPWLNLAGEILGPMGRKQVSAELKGQDKLSFSMRPIENGYQSTTNFDIGLITGAIGAVQTVGQQASVKFDQISRELEAGSRN